MVAAQLDDWLRAELVMVNARPVPLEEGVLAPLSGRLRPTNGEERTLIGHAEAEDALDELVAVALQFIE